MRLRLKMLLFAVLSVSYCSTICAQIGQHRSDFAVGINGGYVLSRVGFMPTVPQKQHGGITAGLSMRYTSEKYFSTICSIMGEINFAQVGWTEDILDADNRPVVNAATNVAEKYSRNLTYIQVPIFAHLAWGKEQKGMQFFLNLGPQFGYMLSEKTSMNYSYAQRNVVDRVSAVSEQETMKVARRFDYGIAAGIGGEYVHPAVGHFLLEARYYYGLGNIFASSKRDYFSRSNFGQIVVKATYLFDMMRTSK